MVVCYHSPESTHVQLDFVINSVYIGQETCTILKYLKYKKDGSLLNKFPNVYKDIFFLYHNPFAGM
jgi:hypothetical protein